MQYRYNPRCTVLVWKEIEFLGTKRWQVAQIHSWMVRLFRSSVRGTCSCAEAWWVLMALRNSLSHHATEIWYHWLLNHRWTERFVCGDPLTFLATQTFMWTICYGSEKQFRSKPVVTIRANIRWFLSQRQQERATRARALFHALGTRYWC